MTRAGQDAAILTPGHCLNLCSRGGAATLPRQEAERKRCAGGRAAWMPREACGAMDGPSRRAPGATMERGNPTKSGRMQGQAFLVSFLATEKRDSPGGETRTRSPLDKQLGSGRSSNT
ncbi:hypothetical protein E8F11_16670 [Pseudomonas sp. BN417]|nr:hypothetical protein [Pseudomonas sp. BN417]